MAPDASEERPGPARQERAEQAASESASSDRLLPGEDLGALNPDDIQHWIGVYSELLTFKREMIAELVAQRDAFSSEEARDEIETTDLNVARAEAERFARRLGYWRQQAERTRATPDQ